MLVVSLVTVFRSFCVFLSSLVKGLSVITAGSVDGSSCLLLLSISGWLFAAAGSPTIQLLVVMCYCCFVASADGNCLLWCLLLLLLRLHSVLVYYCWCFLTVQPQLVCCSASPHMLTMCYCCFVDSAAGNCCLVCCCCYYCKSKITDQLRTIRDYLLIFNQKLIIYI